MRAFHNSEFDLAGEDLAVLATIAAEMGLRNSALTYIERAYRAFDNGFDVAAPANSNVGQIRVTRSNGLLDED